MADDNLSTFLDHLASGDDPVVTVFMVETLMRCWEQFRGVAHDFPSPDVSAGPGPGPHGLLMFHWDRPPHYLSAEYGSEEPVYLFYRNHETGEFWGEDWVPGDPVPEQAVQSLRFFLAT